MHKRRLSSEMAALTIVMLVSPVSLNYIKELGLKDTLWKREQSTQLDFPTNISLMLPISTWKGEGFYVELLLICAFLLK